jgi:ATP synthase protein I
MQQDQLNPERSLNRPDSEKRPDERLDQQKRDLQLLEQQHQRSRQQVFRFILTQLLVTIVLSANLLFFDRIVAYSSLIGGLIATLANAWFAIKVFRVKSTVAAETLLTTFYVGEIYKFIFTGAMFIIAFVMIKPISVVALLVTYFFIHMTPAVMNVLAKDSMSSVKDKEK